MSSGSLRDAIKAVQTAFTSSSISYPIPEELQQTLEDFLDQHQTIDDHDSQRLHDELLSVFNKQVAESVDKFGPFVSVLRILRPAIRGDRRLEEWWRLVIRPTIDSIGSKTDTIEDAREFLLGILVFDAEEDPAGELARLSAQFVDRLLEAYFARTNIPTRDGDMISPQDEFIAQELEGILVAFGKKKPNELLLAIDEQLVDKDRRLQSLSLLSSFVRLQPPHLHLVLETSVLQHLHNCLLIDTSGTVVDLALTILIMFIPHITSSLVESLPKLFLIYARILCWEQFSKEPSERKALLDGPGSHQSTDSGPLRAFVVDTMWEPLDSSFDTLRSVTPKADYFFTFLYGLFPLNFMHFVRKPRRYLRMKNFAGAEDLDLDLDQNLIRTRTEIHRVVHRLHPNFFTTTPEDELTDTHWIKSDPADLVSECLGLCITTTNVLSDLGPPPTAKLPEIPKVPLRKKSSRPDALLSPYDDATTVNAGTPTDARSVSSSWRNTQSTALTAPSIPSDPPRLPLLKSPHGARSTRSSRNPSPSSKPREGSPTLGRIESLGRGGKVPAPVSIPSRPGSSPQDIPDLSPRLQEFAHSLSRSPTSLSQHGVNEMFSTAALQREVMLLKNDLNFERFQKAQYLAQIGQLQRRHIKEATVESETQNLLNKNRMLKAKLAKSDDLYTQLKRETQTSRHQAKRHEEQLTQKLKAYKEEEKKWLAESQALRSELERYKVEFEQLKQLVIDSEIREHDSRDQLGTLTLDLQEMESLRRRLQEAEEKLRAYELRDLDADRTKEDHEILQNELEDARVNLHSRDAELDRLRKTYDQKIVTLESRLRAAQQAQPQVSGSMQQMIDSALASNQAKLAQMKKNYTRLLHKYTELELKLQDFESGRGISQNRSSSVLSLTQYADDPTKLRVGREISARDSGVRRQTSSARRPHAFSDPAPPEDTMYEGEKYSSSAGGASSMFPGQPTRFESLSNFRQQPARAMSPTPFEPQVATVYERGFAHDFQANTTESLSTVKTGMSFDDSKPKPPGSEVRVYGRGGVQNVKKASKEKDKKEKSTKTGGFRGLKGIM
ncbi:hypothetical protein EJ06DRAFT_533899 [Trichodelitschia bisporula]|uniref:Hamartin-domain-containing protein n=1 Tax=Trichodelitschia bisporula TaxID=703511 RepID=A0A6G1HKP6_9PEZI|nr:hypothetical protein EJ06DRAFT_533899 [Trichodelitschia bisporula]